MTRLTFDVRPRLTRLPPLTLEDGNQEESMLALRRMAKAFGGVPELAEEAELNANPLYRTLSPKGNPELKSLRALRRAMGIQLTVRTLRKRVA